MANPGAAKLRRLARSQSPPRLLTSKPDDDSPAANHAPPNLNSRTLTRLPRLAPLSQPTMPSGRPSSVRLLIASLGNPSPYLYTRHSAGHHLLAALVKQLHFPAAVRSNDFAGGAVSQNVDTRPEFTFWQSPTLMNVSGPTLLKAWRHFAKSHTHTGDGDDDVALGLVLLHDELESALGAVKPRRGLDGSAKGHNGVKSVQAALRSAGLGVSTTSSSVGRDLLRIGVGIGRPLSRDRVDVSDFVLGAMTAVEKEKVAGAAGRVLDVLNAHVLRLAGER